MQGASWAGTPGLFMVSGFLFAFLPNGCHRHSCICFTVEIWVQEALLKRGELELHRPDVKAHSLHRPAVWPGDNRSPSLSREEWSRHPRHLEPYRGQGQPLLLIPPWWEHAGSSLIVHGKLVQKTSSITVHVRIRKVSDIRGPGIRSSAREILARDLQLLGLIHVDRWQGDWANESKGTTSGREGFPSPVD